VIPFCHEINDSNDGEVVRLEGGGFGGGPETGAHAATETMLPVLALCILLDQQFEQPYVRTRRRPLHVAPNKLKQRDATFAHATRRRN
jgi:hypothetical protein